MTEDVTVLIANLGSLENLLPCLRSLAPGAGKISFKVIVGFNFQGESDSPRGLASEFPEVEQLRAPTKLGYCRAYNQLMSHSKGRYALLLDDDTVLRPGAIEVMVRFMDDHPNVGVSGCRIVNPDGSYQKSTGLMCDLSVEARNVFQPAAIFRDGVDETVAEWKTVDWLSGALLMARREAIQQVGVLDEYFYTFLCEADWCLRIKNAGWKVAYVPQAEIVHLGGQHSGQTKVKSYRNLIRHHVNRYYFFRKHYGAAAMHALRPVMSAGALLRLMSYAAIWLARPGRRPEAGPKVAAYLKIMLLGVAARPDGLPDALQRENEAFGAQLRPGLPG